MAYTRERDCISRFRVYIIHMFSLIAFVKRCAPCTNSAVSPGCVGLIILCAIVFSPEEKQCHLQAQFLIFEKSKLLFQSKKLQEDAGFENNPIFTFFINCI